MTREPTQLSGKRAHLERRRRSLAAGSLLLASLAASLAVGGCGGGSSSPPVAGASSSGSPAQAKFVASADNICSRVNTEVANLRPKVASPLAVAVVMPRTAAF